MSVDESKTPNQKRTNNLSYTSETVVKRIYSLARTLHDALTKLEITYWATAGTLLGCVRHEGVIPWDDDIDLCIYQNDSAKIEEGLKQLLNEKGFEVIQSEYGYKVFHLTKSDKLPKEDQNHRYPYADLFVMERREKITIHATETGRKVCPQEYYNNDDVDNLKLKPFGEFYLYCVTNPEEYLDRNYGDHWSTEGATNFYDHVYEVYVNPVTFKLRPEQLQPAKPFR